MDWNDLSTWKCELQAAPAARSLHSTCLGRSNPCTSITDPVTDLHFNTKNKWMQVSVIYLAT